MNEVVKYHNDLNAIRVGSFSETQMNILFTIFSKIRDKDTSEITLKIDEIIRLANIQTSNKKQLNDAIFSTFKAMQSLTFRWSDEKAEGQSVAFYEIVREHNKDELTIKINPKFSYLFNNLIGNFTKFELAEFVNLDSKYSKSLYRLLKQYRSTGYFKIEWDTFIDLMDIPKNYRMYDIERQILKPSIQKLSSEQTLFDQKRTPFENLIYKKLKTKGKGNKITGIEFYFSPEKKTEKEQKQSDRALEYIAFELKKQNELKRLQKEKNNNQHQEIKKDIFGNIVNEFTLLIGQHFTIKNNNFGGYDTCKIRNILKISNNQILLEAINLENNKIFQMHFESLNHIKNALKI